MKHSLKVAAFLVSVASAIGFVACNDDNSPIGAELVAGEISITVDSLTISIDAVTTPAEKYDARSQTNIIGRITAPEYGDLNCEYVARLMCASSLPIPDSISTTMIDSVMILLRIPRNQITGDSLSPQQIRVYRMGTAFNEIKADTVTNEFNPDGLYNPDDILASKSYTLSAVAESDVIVSSGYLTLPVKLNGKIYEEFGPNLVEKYRKDPNLFVWPQSFAKYMPGIYVKPVFGSGCIANVSSTQFMVYYHHRYISTDYVDNEVVTSEKVKKDSVALLSTAPEVLSTNRINYRPSAYLEAMQAAGKCIVTTPGGFHTRMSFPAERILKEYQKHDGSASVISNLTFTIPASRIPNDYGIGIPPYMLMIKKSEAAKFFTEGKIPDGLSSFWAQFDTSKGEYRFTSLRSYIIDLSNKREITEEDTEFLLMPVFMNIESNTNKYTGETISTVTSCTPYIIAPSMCELHADRATIVFTYSAQYANN